MWVFCVGFATVSVNFLHFLQKYRCVPKIGFSADNSIDIFIDIFIGIFIDICIDICMDMLIDILTGKEEEEGRRSGLFLKI